MKELSFKRTVDLRHLTTTTNAHTDINVREALLAQQSDGVHRL